MKNLQENTKKYELGRLLDRSEAAKLQVVVEAWKGSGYLYGLKGRDLGRMAILAENQKRQILRENNTTADMAVFDAIAIPMIRRQNALMVTPNFVSVQPLSYPNGVVFFLDYQVSDTKNPIGGNTFGETNPYGAPLSGYDRHYNNLGYDNTKGRVVYRGYTASAVLAAGETAPAATFQKLAVDFGAAGVSTVNVVDFDLTAAGGITMDQAASVVVWMSGVGGTGAGGILVPGTDYFMQKSIMNWTDYTMSTGRTLPNTYNTGTTGGMEDETIASATPGYAQNIQAVNQPTPMYNPSSQQGPANTGNGITGPGVPNKVLRVKIIPAIDGLGVRNLYMGYRTYINLELNPSFSSELRLKITSAPIQTYIHKMKTAWTVELAQDLMAYHAIDAETELTQLMAEEVAAEKDRMIIRELVTLAAHFEVWNADFANAVDPNPANTVFRGTEATYNQTLLLAINRVNGKIQKSTRKGGANWLLISAEGAAKMMNLDTFKPMDTNEEGTKFAAGIEKIGTVQFKYQVYVDPMLPAEICLVGRKGTSFFDTGYVYCPYIEYMLSPTVIDPQEFNPRRQIASRFGTAMLNNKFYGIVWMKNIEVFEVFMEQTTA